MRGAKKRAREMFSEGVTRETILLSLSAGLYWSWWDSFHELFRFLDLAAIGPMSTFFAGGYSRLHCLMKAIGVVAACSVLLLVIRKSDKAGKVSSSSFLGSSNGKLASCALLIFQVIAWVICCSAIGTEHMLAVLAYGAATVLVVPSFVGLAVRLGHLSELAVGWVVVGALGCYGICNNLIYPFFLQKAPIALICLVYLGVLAAAFSLSRLLGCAPADIVQCSGESGRVLPPWRLAVHVMVYGGVFGILHILEGIVPTGPQSVNIGVLFGCLIAIAVFYVLFMRPGCGKEIWSKIRSTVFPFVIVGYLLLPLARNSDIALASTEAGGLLYLAVLFFGCASLMRRTDVAPAVIITWALLLYSVGEGLGVSFMVALIPSFSISSDGYFVLAVIIVVLLTAATFWVASDEQVRKLWGLRREIEPKRYHDLLTQIRVERFADQFGLTPREAEVLRMVAQGRRAPEMVEAMGVSMDTVRTHLKHLYTKLDAHSYAEVVAMMEATEIPDSAMSELLAQEQ